MYTYKYLVIAKDGEADIRTGNNKPTLNWDEIAIGLSIDIPDEAFQKPHLEADISVTEEQAAPSAIEGKIPEQGILSKMDMDVKINISSPDSADNGVKTLADQLEKRLISALVDKLEENETNEGLLKKLKKRLN